MEKKNFLYCKPSVFVIGNEYEILINLNSFGICIVKVGETLYYEENSGVLPSERTVVKIRVPQCELDKAKKYEIVFRETEKRESYWSTFLPPVTAEFEFKPLEKTENIHIYYLSDIHYKFDTAIRTVDFFGEDTDLFIFNGDIGEVETVVNYLDVCAFLGEAAGGVVQMIFTRGNHDTRGRLSELFTDYFPCQEKNTFYTFEIGCISGLVLDCGEDKPDNFKEYDSSSDTPVEFLGLNRFHAYRQRQLEFLKKAELDKSKISLVISHLCPAMASRTAGDMFDIERELYTEWCRELDRISPSFMLCGHYHRAFVMKPNDTVSLIPHKYPVVVGAEHTKEAFWGTAITLGGHRAEIKFTDESHNVCGEDLLTF